MRAARRADPPDRTRHDVRVRRTGAAFADLLAAAPAAIEENAALVVTRPDRLPAATEEFLRAMPNLERIVVVGGRSAIGDNVREALQAILRRRVTLGDAPESNEPRP